MLNCISWGYLTYIPQDISYLTLNLLSQLRKTCILKTTTSLSYAIHKYNI